MATNANAMVKRKTIVKKITIGSPVGLPQGALSVGNLSALDDVNQSQKSDLNPFLRWDSATGKHFYDTIGIEDLDSTKGTLGLQNLSDITQTDRSDTKPFLRWDSASSKHIYDTIGIRDLDSSKGTIGLRNLSDLNSYEKDRIGPPVHKLIAWDSDTAQHQYYSMQSLVFNSWLDVFHLADSSLQYDSADSAGEKSRKIRLNNLYSGDTIVGDSIRVPELTINTQGRIQAVTQRPINGVNNLQWDNTNGIITVFTPAGRDYSATIKLDPWTTDSLAEGSTNLYYTDARADSAARSAFSIQDLGGDGSLEYDSVQGRFIFQGITHDVHMSHHAAVTGPGGRGLGLDSGAGNYYIPYRNPNLVGTWGDASNIPVVTVDSLGMVDSIGTVTVAGVSSASFDSQTGSFTINTADGGVFTTIINDSDFTTKRARNAIVISDLTEDSIVGGHLTYDSSTGVIEYLGLTRTNLRAQFSAAGDLSYDSATGQFSFDVEQVYTKANFDSDFNAALDGTAIGGTGLEYAADSNTIKISDTTVIAGTYGSASLVPIVKVNPRGQIDSIGEVSVAGVSATTFDSASGMFTISTADGGVFNTMLFDSDFTRSRTRDAINLQDVGGDGSLTYDSAIGKFTYTGPSAAEVRAHITGGNGITFTADGRIDIDSASSPTVNSLINTTGSVTTLPTNVQATSAAEVIVDTVAHNSDFMSIEYTVHMAEDVIDASQISKILVTYNKSTVSYAEYGMISSFNNDSDIGTLVADENSGNIRLKFTRATGMGTVNIKPIKHIIS